MIFLSEILQNSTQLNKQNNNLNQRVLEDTIYEYILIYKK